METNHIMEPVFEFVREFYGEENVDISSNRIVVYFKELFIRSSNKKDSHTMREIYFTVTFDSSGKLDSTYITRALRTFDEYESGYVFSHAHSQPRTFTTSTLCYGSGTSMSNILSILKNDFSEEEYILFFTGLESYLTYESIEGAPYIRISVINQVRDNRSYRSYIAQSTFADKCAELQSFKPVITNSDGLKVEILELDRLRQEVSQHFPQACFPHNLQGEEVTLVDSKNKPTSQTRVKQITELNNSLKKSAIVVFKGKRIHPQIQSEIEVNKEEEETENKILYLIRNSEFSSLLSSLKNNLKEALKDTYEREFKSFYKAQKLNNQYVNREKHIHKEV